MKRPLVYVVIACLFMSACTRQYAYNTADTSLQVARLKASFSVERSAQWVVHSATSVALARPQHVQDAVMPRHLTHMHQALDLSLRQAFPDYIALNEASALDSALRQGLRHRKELLFWPELIRSENKLNTKQELIEGQSLNPEQDFGPDRVVFQMRIYEVRTKRLLDVGQIVARGRFFAANDSVPMDLFEQAAREYVAAITGKKPG